MIYIWMLFKCYKSLSLEQFKGTMTLTYKLILVVETLLNESGLKLVLQMK